MNIYILLAHPDKESFNGHIATAYEQAAIAKGHTVRRQNLGEMQFDPILWKGYKEIQALEPDLLLARENITWCNHWIIIYPVWWGSLPALFKGFLDRILLPSFGFKYHEKDPLWDRLLKGRTAEVVSTSDAPVLYTTLFYRNCDKNILKRAVLGFCGIKTVRYTRIGRMKYLDAGKREAILATLLRKARL